MTVHTALGLPVGTDDAMPGAAALTAAQQVARDDLEGALTRALLTSALAPIFTKALDYHGEVRGAGDPATWPRLVAGELADAVVPVWEAHGHLYAANRRQVAQILEAHNRERARAESAEAILEATRLLLPIDPGDRIA